MCDDGPLAADPLACVLYGLLARGNLVDVDRGVAGWFAFVRAGRVCRVYATQIWGKGITATVGGYRRVEVFPEGIHVFRDGQEVAHVPEPRHEIEGDYYANLLARDAAINAILDQYAAIAA